MTIVRTMFSVYEIDQDLHRIRRVNGVNPPTRNTGAPNVWRPYLSVRPLGDGLLIIWSIDEEAERRTWTSKVISIERDPLAP